MQQLGDEVFFGTGTAVNWLIAREGDDLTLIDTGYPGDWNALKRSVASLGASMQDIQGVLLTHGHIDHIGNVNQLWDRYRIPVFADALELPNLTGERLEQATTMDVAKRCWRPTVAKWALKILLAGATKHQTITHAQALPDEGPVDLPGRPVPVRCPGHTSGHCGYWFPDAGVLATGDALITGHELVSSTGPQLLPDFFATSPCGAVESLDYLGDIDAGVVAPGHGRPFDGSPAEAVASVRRSRPPIQTQSAEVIDLTAHRTGQKVRR